MQSVRSEGYDLKEGRTAEERSGSFYHTALAFSILLAYSQVNQSCRDLVRSGGLHRTTTRPSAWRSDLCARWSTGPTSCEADQIADELLVLSPRLEVLEYSVVVMVDPTVHLELD